MEELEIGPPFYLLISVFDAENSVVPVDLANGIFDPHLTDRNILLVPDVEVQWPTNDLAATLRPAFDMLWQSWDFEQSQNYDLNGNWRG